VSTADSTAPEVEAPRKKQPEGNPPAEDEKDLISKAGEIAEDVLARFQETENSARTITLIINAGRIENAFGSVEGNVSAGGPEPGSQVAAHPDASLSVADWFQASRDVLDAALMAAAAFLPSAPFSEILSASHRLAALLSCKPIEPANPFTTGRAARLSRLGAVVVATPDAGQSTVPVERLLFSDRNRVAEARNYLWREATDIRTTLTRWLTELSQHDNGEVAYSAGYAVGQCASVDIAGIFNELLRPWVLSEHESSRVAAGQALSAAIGFTGCRELARSKVEQWSQPDSSRECKRAVASLCRSAWAIAEPDEAFKALKRIEKTQKAYAGKWVQQAINTMWIGASLYSKEYPTVPAAIVSNLTEWSTTDRSSVFYTTPQLHLAFAGLSEIALLKHHERGKCPLLLRLVEENSTVCGKAAALLGTGLTRKASRKHVRAFLDKLVCEYHSSQRDALSQFLSLIARGGTEDDRDRLKSYVEGWRAGELKADIRIDWEERCL
jgi:hypothetical protein